MNYYAVKGRMAKPRICAYKMFMTFEILKSYKSSCKYSFVAAL